MPDQAGVSQIRWGWRERLIARLFPIPPGPTREGDPRTYITSIIGMRIDWKDRLRLLIHPWAEVRMRTYTDVEVKEAESVSTVHVIPPRWL